MFNWMKRKKEQEISPIEEPVMPSTPLTPDSSTEETVKVEKKDALPVNKAAEAQIEKLHVKVDAVAERFAKGEINRMQFHELFDYYQGKIQELEQFLAVNPESDEWRNIVNDGQSIILRKRYSARLSGFAIIDHRNGLPLRTIGGFGVDPALFVPMLYAYQSATKEIFGGSVRSTQIEGGRWLCFVSGKITTTLALFNTEPSQIQLRTLEQVHKVFESANAERLMKSQVDVEALVCPHEYYLQHPL
jgi:hypothetical protein